jgi:hypothetical protein
MAFMDFINVTGSDVFGLFGSSCLLIPPARDQYLRVRAHMSRAGFPSQTALDNYGELIHEGWERERNSWNPGDSLFTMVGSLLIFLSFLT